MLSRIRNRRFARGADSSLMGVCSDRARQFTLLLWKDWVLIRRNKLWTFLEFVLPLFFTLPLIILIVKYQDIEPVQGESYRLINITGGWEDFDITSIQTQRVITRWCAKSKVKLAYFGATVPNAETIIQELLDRYPLTETSVEISAVPFNDEDQMINELRSNLPNSTSKGSICFLRNYVFGISLYEFDASRARLSYRFYVPEAPSDQWLLSLENVWEDPFGVITNHQALPSQPPFFSSAFITFQHALESIFISKATGYDEARNETLRLRRWPEPQATQNSISALIGFMPYMWGLAVFFNLLHTAREIASEKSTTKPLLSAMGLNSFLFYLSHVTVGFLKFFFIILICFIPLNQAMGNASFSLLFTIVLLYGLGAVVFSALIASMFKTPNTTIKVLVISWIVLNVLSFRSPPVSSKLKAYFASLNINSAFRYSALAVSEFMSRDRVLSWNNMFEDAYYQFSCGEAFAMLLFDVIWMSTFTWIFDKIFGQPDFSFRNLFKFGTPANCESDSIDGASALHSASLVSNRQRQGVREEIQLSNVNSDDRSLLPDSNETDCGREKGTRDIDVKGLVKVYSETGETAVADLSLNAVRGEVAVLLGHNGAGKSTTFSSIAGIIAPTAGQIKICGHDVSTHRAEARKVIGLCPQHNPLYDKLTVYEHLWLVHGLKGADKLEFKDEAEYLLTETKLFDKRKEKAMNLSGGMKRKLCVCMALIGKSKVVLLDEPTAGMDPGARKNVQQLLEKEKNNRTVLLTTHYMDEAERLGDWVFIMSHGQLVASGTNQFLKQKFGSGYLLTVVMEDVEGASSKERQKMMEHHTSKLLQICSAHGIHEAKRGEMHGKQIEIVLPEKDKDKFVSLFNHLEKYQRPDWSSRPNRSVSVSSHSSPTFSGHELRISSFGLSLNTLEQVFIRIGDMAESALSRQASHSLGRSVSDTRGTSHLSVHPSSSAHAQLSQHSYAELIESQGKPPDRKGASKVFAQYKAIWRKRLLYARRNWPQPITQVVAPLIILGFISLIAGIKAGSSLDTQRNFTLTEFGHTRIPILLQSPSLIASKYYEMAKEAEGSDYVPVYNSSGDSLERIVETLPHQLPSHGIGAAFYANHSEALFNARAHHSIPTTITVWNTARLRSLMTGGMGSISPQVMAYTRGVDTQTAMLPKELVNFLLGPLLILALALLTSTFVMVLVEERSSRFAHQQSLSGISPLTFWSATFLYDLVFYTLTILLFLVVFWISKWLSSVLGFVFLFWMLYFFACMPFIYSVSFLFNSPSKANVLLIVWQILAALGALIIFYLLKYFQTEDSPLANLVNSIFLFLLPSYAMATALVDMAICEPFFSKLGYCVDVNDLSNPKPHNMLDWNILGKLAVCMISFSICASFLFLSLQFKTVRRQISQIWDIGAIKRAKVNSIELPFEVDEQALENEKKTAMNAEIACKSQETGRAMSQGVSTVHADVEIGNVAYSMGNNEIGVQEESENKKDEFVLIVNALVKKYGSLAAINELYLAVRQGECFGLLGVNGAGKTTTFNILTGQTFATSGNARIDGKDVTNRIPLGYCPQFDALLLDLTGKETLEILAQMHGYSNYKDKAALILESVGMKDQADKLVRYYSGGQKRKLSVGVALLAPTKMIILDEPTAGIDPKARRDIWELLLGVRRHSHSAIILTSHSLDECEALCSRIAVLSKGKLIAIGESQTLKSKYGGNYTMTMAVPKIEMKEEVKRGVEENFTDSVIKTSEESKTLNLKWLIPRKQDDRWSEKFSQVQQLAKKLDVQDYCLAQSSLEDAFLRLSEEKT